MRDAPWKLFVTYLGTKMVCDVVIRVADIGPDTVELLKVTNATMFGLHVIAEFSYRYGPRLALFAKKIRHSIRDGCRQATSIVHRWWTHLLDLYNRWH